MEVASILIALLVIGWIVWPLQKGASESTSELVAEDLPLEERYTRAMLDLESDLLGGRITDAEFNRRRESLTRSLETMKG